MRSVPPRGSGWVIRIVDCQLPIGCHVKTDWQSEIDTRQCKRPTRYRVVVLTSWDRNCIYRNSLLDSNRILTRGDDGPAGQLPRRCVVFDERAETEQQCQHESKSQRQAGVRFDQHPVMQCAPNARQIDHLV